MGPADADADAHRDESCWPSAEELLNKLDGLFGLLMHQRMRCLGGSKAEKTQQSLSLQVTPLWIAFQDTTSQLLMLNMVRD
jgi:hypothetical protein